MTASQSRRLSVCCMSGGRNPDRLAAIMALFGGVADEIVVAVEEPRALKTYAAVDRVVDRVLSFPPTQPSDRPIAWLFGSCTGDWILNVDDDEVPSPRLLEMLPSVVARDDITHGWIARRWLHPTTADYLDEAPWNNEFQLRLLLADRRFTQFSDVFHLPVVAHGPGVYLDTPLWHLDTALNSVARRRAKAEAYELERPGMRISGRSHNHALYVPELVPRAAVAPVPREDRAQIEHVLAGAPPPTRAEGAALVFASSSEIDLAWPGPPHGGSLHRGRVEAAAAPRALRAGVQETVDVTVTNDSDRTWRWGKDARPTIRLGYRWSRNGTTVDEPIALRTVLPADLAPGASQVVPVHVVPPAEPARYALQLELVHEGVGAFAATPPVELDVLERERLAVVGDPVHVMRLLAKIAAPPYVEPVVVLGNDADRSAYGDYPCVSGLRAALLEGLEDSGRISRGLRLSWRSLTLVRRARRYRRTGATGLNRLDALFDLLHHARGLFVAGIDWPENAATGREWWRLVTTLAVGRGAGCPVYVSEQIVPSGTGLRAVVLRRAIRRYSEPVGGMTLDRRANRVAREEVLDDAEALIGVVG
jgi:hypothetical protein